MKLIGALPCCCFLLLSACASPRPPQTLYTQLGGLGMIENIANAFIYELRKRDDVYPFFEDSSIERFRGSVIDHICQVSEGPCGHSKKSTQYIHADSKTKHIAFNGKTEVLINAMSTVGVSHMLQKVLLKRLVPMQIDISYVSR